MTFESIAQRIDNGIDNKVIQGVSFNQFTDFDKIQNGVIVFSDEVMKYIISSLIDTKRNTKENGCFLYGREIVNNYIIIDKIGSSFYSSERGVEVLESNIDEMKELVNKYDEDTNERLYNTVIHFHTHPNIQGLQPENVSDQDLYSYGVTPKYNQYNEKEYTSFLGLLASVSNNGYKMSCMFYDMNTKKFYTIPNMYTQANDKIKRINNEDINLVDLSNSDKKLLIRKR